MQKRKYGVGRASKIILSTFWTAEVMQRVLVYLRVFLNWLTLIGRGQARHLRWQVDITLMPQNPTLPGSI